jgi:hypothetical protein
MRWRPSRWQVHWVHGLRKTTFSETHTRQDRDLLEWRRRKIQRVAGRFYIFQHVKFLTRNKMLVLGSYSLREEAWRSLPSDFLLKLFLSQFMFQFQTYMSNLEPNSRCIYSKIKNDNSESGSSYKTQTRLLFNFWWTMPKLLVICRLAIILHLFRFDT